jgi:hypothetical protein
MRPLSPKLIATLVIGGILIVFGVAMIVGARHVVREGWGYGNVDGIRVYVVWDAFQLATGIILALGGTAVDTSSLTCFALTRRKESEPRKRP